MLTGVAGLLASQSLRHALAVNAAALKGFWLGYTLKAQMKDAKGIAALRAWVEKHGGPTWWAEQWEPLVRSCAKPGALAASGDAVAAPAASAGGSTARAAMAVAARRCQRLAHESMQIAPGLRWLGRSSRVAPRRQMDEAKLGQVKL
jgi:hypothetical protein